MSGEMHDNICRYHYAHRGDIEAHKKEIDKIQYRFDELNKTYIKDTTELKEKVEGFEKLVDSMKESFNDKLDDLFNELTNLKEGLKDKVLKIRYSALTVCGISSFLAVLVIELIKWVMSK